VRHPQIRLRIDFGPSCSLGPGKIALLEAIADTGSLSQAARQHRMSYRRAWLLLADVNASFAEAATQSATGGRGGGGMRLTPFGKRLIAQFRSLERSVGTLGARRLETLAAAAVRSRRRAGRARSLKRGATRR
jgi:molybdate transport system regulatory protein